MICSSPYVAPLPLRNGHAHTIAAHFRAGPLVPFYRERIDTADGDFLDLDWLRDAPPYPGAGRPLVILSHGLEGNARRPYMAGMALAFRRAGWDALAWNFRGCSGEPNRLVRPYHSGATDDLDAVVRHALATGYTRVGLVGFSLGGNLTLKYLGERTPDPRIVGGVALSAPVDLEAGSVHMKRLSNTLYTRRFLRSMRAKVLEKHRHHPHALDVDGIERIRDFDDFDGRYTAPLNGFASAEEYWRRSSAKPLLLSIRTPTLILSADDDPILPPAAYPYAEAEANPCVHLEVPPHGGHIGFIDPQSPTGYYSEARAVAFLHDHAGR